jgi:hypothetical protein
VVTNVDVQDKLINGQLAAVDRLRGKDFAGALLRIVNGILTGPRSRSPRVTFDFWDQFDAAEALEELRLDRPSVYRALPAT